MRWDTPDPFCDNRPHDRCLQVYGQMSLTHESEPHARVAVGACFLHPLTERACVSHVATELDARHGGWIVTANVDYARRMVCDHEFAALCADASLVVADGMPLVWASRLRGRPVPERVTGSSLIWTLSAMAETTKRSVYLLGGSPGTAENAAAVLQRRHPDLRVAGIASPQLTSEINPDDLQAVADSIAEAQPDIVFVALGSPKSERLIAALRPRHPRVWWIGVGISFSFVSGDVARAPAWMQRAGMEWLHRVVQEPTRLARRYFVDDAPFAAMLLASAAWSRLQPDRERDE